MKNNPLIDVAAILACIVVVIILGQYFEAKKQSERLQHSEKHVEVKKEVSKVENKTFEHLSKRTE